MRMRIAQTMLASLVMLAVFIAPLQAGCCMTSPQPSQKAPTSHSCCAMKMASQPVPSNEPLSPCRTDDGQCPKCTHTVLAHNGCTSDDAALTASQSPDIATLLNLHFMVPAVDQPLVLPVIASSPVAQVLPSVSARSLCAQHCLLTI
jgi:hypothetical protein